MSNTPYQIKTDGNVYRRGTLAQLLDTRNIAVGEPTRANLPASINPLRFLCDNLIVNNSFVVKIKQDAIQTDNDYVKLLSDLQYTVPPEKAVLLCIELSDIVDNMDVAKDSEDITICDSTNASDIFNVIFSDYVCIARNRDECDA